jgi:hypothetical protein
MVVLRQSQLNLAFIQGDATPQVLSFRHAIELTVALASGQSSLSISASPLLIPINTTLDFEGRTVVTSAPIPANATTASIAVYSGLGIPLGSIADAGSLDSTGRVYTASVRQTPTSPTALFNLVCNSAPATAGQVQLSLPVGLSTPVNAQPRQFSVNLLDKPDPNATELYLPIATTPNTVNSSLLQAAYHWDLKYTQSSVTTQVLSGRFWLLQGVV